MNSQELPTLHNAGNSAGHSACNPICRMPAGRTLPAAALSAVAAVVLAVALASGAVIAQGFAQGAAQQDTQPTAQPPAAPGGQIAAPGAVPQHGGAVARQDRAPDLSLSEKQRAAFRTAVLTRRTAQKPVPGFTPEAGATAPRALKLESMPPDIVQEIPALRHFFVADIANRQALIVNGMDRKIVAVVPLTDDAASTAAAPTAANDPHVEKSADRPPPTNTAVFRNGVLTAPGAPKNGETAPAKFSAINAALDDHPTMSGGADLTAEQAAEVFRAVMADKSVQPVAVAVTEPAAQVPNLTPAHPWPDALVQKFPALATYAYIKTADKVLIVTPANKILVGWIDAQGQDPSSQPAAAAAAARGS